MAEVWENNLFAMFVTYDDGFKVQQKKYTTQVYFCQYIRKSLIYLMFFFNLLAAFSFSISSLIANLLAVLCEFDGLHFPTPVVLFAI